VAAVFNSLGELCQRHGLPLGPVSEAVERFNRQASAGVDDDFGRDFSHSDGALVEGPPYYSLRLSAKAHFCQGGIKIDPRCRVLSAGTLKPIPGLLAAGEIVGGTHGLSRLANNAITEALVFGRLAGREAATGP
jgi:succinate dehydrogenase/fumarate reductase flavoprotein subunit